MVRRQVLRLGAQYAGVLQAESCDEGEREAPQGPGEGREVSGGDIRYLLELGLTVDEIAHRAGRTVKAITTELEKDADND